LLKHLDWLAVEHVKETVLMHTKPHTKTHTKTPGGRSMGMKSCCCKAKAGAESLDYTLATCGSL
jgi:hypothetical protein